MGEGLHGENCCLGIVSRRPADAMFFNVVEFHARWERRIRDQGPEVFGFIPDFRIDKQPRPSQCRSAMKLSAYIIQVTAQSIPYILRFLRKCDSRGAPIPE